MNARTSSSIVVCAFLLCTSVNAQTSSLSEADLEAAMGSIQPQAIRGHMRFLASDLLEGRSSVSRGYDLAARYVAAGFEGLGLEPAGAGGSYLQSVLLQRATLAEAECSVALVHDGRDGKRSELRLWEEYIMAGAGALEDADASITAPIVFAGFGMTAPEFGYDDYSGLDVRGKIVALLTGAPSSFPPDQRAFYTDGVVKARNAASHGAAGMLIIFTPELEKIVPWDSLVHYLKTPGLFWVDGKGVPDAMLPELRGSAILSRKAAEELFKGTPRSLDDVFAAAEAGRPGSFELPVQASLRTVSRRERVESPNVAAVLRGSDPRLRDEYIVLSAHLDHVGIGEPVAGDAIHNGAYDNASGIAMLLELARAFARLPTPPRRSLLFLAVTGEEDGLQGSDFFAHHPTVPADRIVANINLDMVLMLHPLHDVVAFGAEHSDLGSKVGEAARRLGIKLSPDPFPEQVMFIRSDHYSFVQKGIPSLFLVSGFETADPGLDGMKMFGSWMQDHYHQPNDDMAQPIDFTAGAQFAKLGFLSAYLVAQDDKAPSWNPGDFFGSKFP